jgi:hypothetical protein
MSDKTTTIETLVPIPIETPATTEVPNAADVTFEESNGDDEDDEPELNSSR